MGLPYDSLLVATGASPRTLGVPGENLRGIHYLRKISDAESIREDLSSSSGTVVLAGGGLVGVKSLEALVNKRRKIHLVVSSDRVLSQMLDKAASDLFLECFAREGVRVHLRTEITSFQGNGRLAAALLSDGTLLPCGLAIVGKGVRPNVDLLQGTGTTLGLGVRVGQHMATNIPGIYAAGDVAEPFDLLQERNAGNAIWPVAVEGGRVAGGNMVCEGSASLSAVVRMNAVEVLGTRVVSAGNWEGEQEVRYFRRESPIYRKLAFSGNRLSGFLLAGDIRGAGVLTSLIKNRTEISASTLEEGLERGFSYAPKLQALGGSIQARET
jgi:NAD(P)H-nitrite reductase large subunit